MRKTIFYTTLSVLALFGVLFYFSSCKPNPCVTRAVECKNGGSCKDGECLCASGYEGDSCQFRVNQKFDSYYACIRTRLINGTIVEDNDDTLRVKAMNDKFIININSVRDSIVEVVSGTVNDNYITISQQSIQIPPAPPKQGYTATYYGNGSLNNGVLTITLYKTWVDGIAYSSKTSYVGYKY